MPIARTEPDRWAWSWDYHWAWSRYHDMTELTATQIAYLASQRLGRLATAGNDHKPHVVPTSFRYNSELGTVDVGGLHVETTKKYRDVQANGWAAIVVDDLVSTDPWTPRMLEIRGRAEAIPDGGAHLGPGFGAAFIRIHPDKVNSFGLP
jgi:pyridoxamine 5'-phosphate oxidase family protein